MPATSLGSPRVSNASLLGVPESVPGPAPAHAPPQAASATPASVSFKPFDAAEASGAGSGPDAARGAPAPGKPGEQPDVEACEEAARSAIRMNLQARYNRWEDEGLSLTHFRNKYRMQHLGVLTLLLSEMCITLPGLFADPPTDPAKFENFLFSVLQQDEDAQQGKLKLVTKVYFLALQAKEACDRRERSLQARYEWMRKSFESRLEKLAALLEKSVNTRGQLARDRERVSLAISESMGQILSVMRRVESAAQGVQRRLLSKQYVLHEGIKNVLQTLLQIRYNSEVEAEHYKRHDLFQTLTTGFATLRDIVTARIAEGEREYAAAWAAAHRTPTSSPRASPNSSPTAAKKPSMSRLPLRPPFHTTPEGAVLHRFVDIVHEMNEKVVAAVAAEGGYFVFRERITKLHGMLEALAVPVPVARGDGLGDGAIPSTPPAGGNAHRENAAGPGGNHAGAGDGGIATTLLPFRDFQKDFAAQLCTQTAVDRYVKHLRTAHTQQQIASAGKEKPGGAHAGVSPAATAAADPHARIPDTDRTRAAMGGAAGRACPGGGAGISSPRAGADASQIRYAAQLLLDVWRFIEGIHTMLKAVHRRVEAANPTSRTCDAAVQCCRLAKRVLHSDLAGFVRTLRAQYAKGFEALGVAAEVRHAAIERCRQVVVGLMCIWPFYSGFGVLRGGLVKLSKATYIAIDEAMAAEVSDALYTLDERVANVSHAAVKPSLHRPYEPPKKDATPTLEEARGAALRDVMVDVELQTGALGAHSDGSGEEDADGEPCDRPRRSSKPSHSIDDVIEAAVALLQGEAIMVELIPYLEEFKDLAADIAETPPHDDAQVDVVVTAIACAEHIVNLQGPCCALLKTAHNDLKAVRTFMWDIITYDGWNGVFTGEARQTVAKCVDRMEHMTRNRQGRWDQERLKLVGVREDGWARALAQVKNFDPRSVFRPTLGNQHYEMRRFEDIALTKFRQQQEQERRAMRAKAPPPQPQAPHDTTIANAAAAPPTARAGSSTALVPRVAGATPPLAIAPVPPGADGRRARPPPPTLCITDTPDRGGVGAGGDSGSGGSDSPRELRGPQHSTPSTAGDALGSVSLTALPTPKGRRGREKEAKAAAAAAAAPAAMGMGSVQSAPLDVSVPVGTPGHRAESIDAAPDSSRGRARMRPSRAEAGLDLAASGRRETRDRPGMLSNQRNQSRGRLASTFNLQMSGSFNRSASMLVGGGSGAESPRHRSGSSYATSAANASPRVRPLDLSMLLLRDKLMKDGLTVTDRSAIHDSPALSNLVGGRAEGGGDGHGSMSLTPQASRTRASRVVSYASLASPDSMSAGSPYQSPRGSTIGGGVRRHMAQREHPADVDDAASASTMTVPETLAGSLSESCGVVPRPYPMSLGSPRGSTALRTGRRGSDATPDSPRSRIRRVDTVGDTCDSPQDDPAAELLLVVPERPVQPPAHDGAVAARAPDVPHVPPPALPQQTPPAPLPLPLPLPRVASARGAPAALPRVASASGSVGRAASTRALSASLERKAYPLKPTQPQLAVSARGAAEGGGGRGGADPILGTRRQRATWRTSVDDEAASGPAVEDGGGPPAAAAGEHHAVRVAAQREERRRLTAGDDRTIEQRRQALRERAQQILGATAVVTATERAA